MKNYLPTKRLIDGRPVDDINLPIVPTRIVWVSNNGNNSSGNVRFALSNCERETFSIREIAG